MVVSPYHHFIVTLRSEARVTQLAMLASWSRALTMISEPAGKWGRRAMLRLRKSCVVDGPRTLICE